MLVKVFKKSKPEIAHSETHNVRRSETHFIADDEQEYRVIVLEADDSFDVVVHYPNDERECVWSLVRDPQL